MPVKVRCSECANVFAAPDAARGKAVKCPDCASRVKVPIKGARRKKKKKPVRPANGDDLFAGLDLRNAEDDRTKICPKCATTIRDDELEECPSCGVNIFTGQLSERQRAKQSNKGPDPEDFSANVWKRSLAFVKKNRSLVTRTAINWTVYLTLAMASLYISVWSYGREVDGMRNDDENSAVSFTATQTIIDGTPDSKGKFRGASYSKRTVLPHPRVLAHWSPVVNFWRFFATVFAFGFAGWAIYLATLITKSTMLGEKMDRIQPDFFGNITMGIRAYVWPWLVLMPLPLIVFGIFGAVFAMSDATVLSQGQQIFIGVAIGGLYLLSVLLLPPAIVHWSQNHTYPAWLLTRMVTSFGKTAKASLMMSGASLLFCGLLPIGVAVGAAVGSKQLANVWTKILNAVGGTIGLGAGSGFFDFTIVALPLFILIVGLILFILFFIVAFPTVYMMRAIGLYGLYHRNQLDLVGETTAGIPAGFGPRYLAFGVDLVILSTVLGVLVVLQILTAGFSPIYPAVLGLVQLLFLFFYFVSSETGQARATPGKWSLGLMVLQQNNKPMDKSVGQKRTVFSLFSALSFFGGFIMCLFTPDKAALHDRMSKTKVCWKGDDARS
ncbi:MAG: RDD family protein [Planctomycetaceae bacterium]